MGDRDGICGLGKREPSCLGQEDSEGIITWTNGESEEEDWYKRKGIIKMYDMVLGEKVNQWDRRWEIDEKKKRKKRAEERTRRQAQAQVSTVRVVNLVEDSAAVQRWKAQAWREQKRARVEEVEEEEPERRNEADVQEEVGSEEIAEGPSMPQLAGNEGRFRCHECGGPRMTWRRTPNPASPRHYAQKIPNQCSGSPPLVEVFTHAASHKFPTERRPQRRPLDWKTEMDEVNQWVGESGIQIGAQAKTAEQKEVASRILYTWCDLFATDIADIRKTDLVTHTIPLKQGAKPYQARQHLYTPEERAWFDENLPKLLEANIICFCDSPWSSKSKFVRKQNGQLRFVNVFCPLNEATEKAVGPMQRSEFVTDTVIREGCDLYFACDGSNGYWGVPTAQADIFKTAFTTPNGQFAWTRIGQGLKGGPFTYSRFGNIAFGAIPGPVPEPALQGSHRVTVSQPYAPLKHSAGSDGPDQVNFSFFMDDTYGSSSSFESMAQFLHEDFFPRCDWAPMALNPRKSVFFSDQIGILGLTGDRHGLRPDDRKLKVMREYPIPRSFEEVEQFLYLIPYLRRYIPGRAEYARILKTSLRHLEDGSPTFVWEPQHQAAFDAVRAAILNNTCTSGDPTRQYHLACDASKTGLGAVLFQLQDVPPNTKTSAKTRDKERVVMFISQRFTKAEMNYSTTEREALAVVRSLEEVRHLILGSEHPTIVYTDHSALTTLLTGDATKGRIATWQNIVSEFDLKIVHVPGKELALADGLLRLPERAREPPRDGQDEERRQVKLVRFEGEQEEDPREERMEGTLRGEVAAQVAECFTAEVIQDEEDLVGLAERAKRVLEEGKRSGDPVRYPYDPVRDETQGENDESKKRMAVKEAEDFLEKMQGWKKWLDSEWYGEVVHWLLTGQLRRREPEGVDRGDRRKRWVTRQARKFLLSEAHGGPLYREANGEVSECLLPHQVADAIYRVHNVHGHFFTPINQKQVIGRYFWPTRHKDIASYAATCDNCQRLGPIKKWRRTRPIFVLNPMGMLGMDFFGPISPASITGKQYGFVVCDYMTRYVFLFATSSPDFASVKEALEGVFRSHGAPMVIYSDGGAAFKGATKWLESMGVHHLFAPPYHPQSVGLAESVVKMVLQRLRMAWVDNPEKVVTQWDQYLPEIALAMNTRHMRRFGFSPFELMYGRKYENTNAPLFSALVQARIQELKQPDDSWRIVTPTDDEKDLPLTALGADVIERTEEIRELARQRLLKEQDTLIEREIVRGWKLREGDLVLLRRHALDKQHGQKLLPRWDGPFRVVKNLASGNSHVLEHLDGSRLKGRYSIDSLKPYLSREEMLECGEGINRDELVNYKLGRVDLYELFTSGVYS